jgi:hypothetical protein
MHPDHCDFYRRLVRDQAARLNPAGGATKKTLGLGPGHVHVIGVWLAQTGFLNLWETEK